MFKAMILQAMHALSDERTEFLIKDRLSFMRFPRAGIGRCGFPTPTRSGRSARR